MVENGSGCGLYFMIVVVVVVDSECSNNKSINLSPHTCLQTLLFPS